MFIRKQGKQNLANYPSNNHPTKHHISVGPTYVLNTIQKQTKNLFKLTKLSTTLHGCVQTHFPLTIEQPLDYKSTMPPVSVESMMNQ